MNENNFEFLGNQLKYSGFGEDLQQQLKEKMKQQEPQFTIAVQKDFGNDKTAATLHFRKSDESDRYFFNRFTLMLTNKQHPDTIKQSFQVNYKEDSITLKEAYNLLSGRAVHKDMTNKAGDNYKAWLQLDFRETDTHGNYKVKQYHENYNYDLAAVLQKHPIKELQNENDQKRLIESLERGNRQSVTMTLQGKEQKVYVEAVPQFKSLNFYEPTGYRIRMDKQAGSQSQDQQANQTEKQKINIGKQGGEEEPAINKNKTKKPGHKVH